MHYLCDTTLYTLNFWEKILLIIEWKQQENKAFNPPRILLTSRISRLEIELLHIPVSSIKLELEAPPLAITQLFWLFAIRFGLQGRSSNFKPRSNWKGSNKSIHKQSESALSEISYLPMLNSKSDDFSTVYTTIVECMKSAKSEPLIITFDFPL